jgi:hypothetical protein
MSNRVIGDGPTGSIVIAALFALAAVAFGLRAVTAWEIGARAELLLTMLAALGAISVSVRSFRRARRVDYPARLGR